MPDGIYETGEYWKKNLNMHQEDSEYKVDVALSLLSKTNLAVSSLVDVGCGSGKVTYLAQRRLGCHAVGLDVSKPAIAHAKEAYKDPNLQYRCEDICEITETFDLGLMFDVFEHVDDYIGFLRAARPKARHWIFNIPMDMNVSGILRDAYIDFRHEMGHLHYFSEKSALETLSYCGFTVSDTAFAPAFLHFLKTKFSVKRAIAVIPRLITYKVSERTCTKLFGGTYFFVLAQDHNLT